MSSPNLGSQIPEGGPESVKSLVRHAAPLTDQLAAYFQAHLKKIFSALKLDLLQTLFWVLILVLFMQAAYLSLSLVLHGGGEGLGILLGNRPWLGSLLVGATLLLLILLGIQVLMASLRKAVRQAQGEPQREREKIEASLAAISQDIAGAFELKAWVRQYPLPTTGAVAVLGFWVGGQLVHGEDSVAPVAAASAASGAAAVPWFAPLLEIAMSTLSDVTKDVLHQWLQQNPKESQENLKESLV